MSIKLDMRETEFKVGDIVYFNDNFGNNPGYGVIYIGIVRNIMFSSSGLVYKIAGHSLLRSAQDLTLFTPNTHLPFRDKIGFQIETLVVGTSTQHQNSHLKLVGEIEAIQIYTKEGLFEHENRIGDIEYIINGSRYIKEELEEYNSTNYN